MTRLSGNVVRPAPTLLGYACKEFLPPPSWHQDPRVEFIASVTECNMPRPEGYGDRWDFNAAGYYETPFYAEAAFGGSKPREKFGLFAYELFPLRFFGGHVAPAPIVSVFGMGFGLLIPEVWAGFEFLGYDVVQRWAEAEPGHVERNAFGGGFGCSPLFCNEESKGHPVNRHCLLTEWDAAVRAAHQFGIEQPEPGCYFIFGVYMQRDPNV